VSAAPASERPPGAGHTHWPSDPHECAVSASPERSDPYGGWNHSQEPERGAPAEAGGEAERPRSWSQHRRARRIRPQCAPGGEVLPFWGRLLQTSAVYHTSIVALCTSREGARRSAPASRGCVLGGEAHSSSLGPTRSIQPAADGTHCERSASRAGRSWGCFLRDLGVLHQAAGPSLGPDPSTVPVSGARGALP